MKEKNTYLQQIGQPLHSDHIIDLHSSMSSLQGEELLQDTLNELCKAYHTYTCLTAASGRKISQEPYRHLLFLLDQARFLGAPYTHVKRRFDLLIQLVG